MKSKNTLVIISLLFIGFIYFHVLACQSKTQDYKRTPNDTTRTWCDIVTPINSEWQSNGVTGDIGAKIKLIKITKDTIVMDSESNSKVTGIWKRDSIYYLELIRPAMDSANPQIQKVDSAGRKLYYPTLYFPLDKKFILVDYNQDPNSPAK